MDSCQLCVCTPARSAASRSIAARTEYEGDVTLSWVRGTATAWTEEPEFAIAQEMERPS